MNLRSLTAVASLAAIALAGPALADTLIDNINGITVARDGQVQRFAAMVIDEDTGRVVETYRDADDAPRTDYRVDGKGRVLVPGMIDSHGHVMGMGLAALSLDLTAAANLQEAQVAVMEYAARYPDRPWLVGRGWNQEVWGLGRFPTAAELDNVTGARPVYFERVDGHAAWVNSAALARAGITKDTPDPAGGRIERDAAGNPTGVLVDAAMELVGKEVTPPRPVDRDLALSKAQQLLFARGVTAMADMGTTIEDWQSYRRAGDAGWLQMRIFGYAAGTDQMLLIAGPRPTDWLYQDRLRLNGVKLYLDGALGSRGALLKQPYADDPGNRGLALISPAELRNRMSRAAMDNFQTAVHAIGDEANAEALLAVEELATSFTGDRRWRIEHVQIVDPIDIPRFGQNGIVASMQPVHQTSDRTMAEARLGPNRLGGAYAWRSIAAAGAPLAFGSDAPVELPDPWAGIAAAVSREDADGQPFGGWRPEETVTREAALAAYTSGGAYAVFGEGRFGELKAGQRADFVLIDRDPLLSTAAEIRETQVIETWVNGVMVYDSRGRTDAVGPQEEDMPEGR